MFKSPNGWHIVDYKTDVVAADRALAYEHQLKMYEKALAANGITRATATVLPVRLVVEPNDRA
jgi:ATP-dependent exoDNAse (exonuclease V) beta subunit